MLCNVISFICPVNKNVWHKESQYQVTKLNTKGHYYYLQILANKIHVLFQKIQVVCIFLHGVLMMLCSDR